MESPLVVVFLAVIALTALLQAAFVGALAFGVRMGRQKMQEAEEKFEATVTPRLRDAARLTGQAATLSEKSLSQARRVDSLLAETSRKAERHLDQAAVRFEGAVGRAALRVDDALETRAARIRENRVVRRLTGASAFLKGVQRALEVWQATAAADGDGDDTGDGGPPADPSPA
jgi:hypothetical protein